MRSCTVNEPDNEYLDHQKCLGQSLNEVKVLHFFSSASTRDPISVMANDFYLFANCNFVPGGYVPWQAAYDDLAVYVFNSKWSPLASVLVHY